MEAISKARFSLKQILRDNWRHFVLNFGSLVSFAIAYNVWKVMNCREPDGLGYATYACPDHPQETYHVPRTCKSRFCSVCAKVQIDKWVSDIGNLFPNSPYFHIVFTVPSEFRELLFEKKVLLNAVFSASSETLLSFCKEQGFLPALTGVLHTFGSDLKRHVHIHFIISAGGLKLSDKAERRSRYLKRKKKDPRAKRRKVSVLVDKPQWLPWSFFPYKMLRKRYQSLLIGHLKEQIQRNLRSDTPDPELKVFSEPSVMKSFFDTLRREHKNGFIVNVSQKREDLESTAGYIGRYARRPPLSEVRIKDYTGEYVTFEYKDYLNNDSKVLHTLRTVEFIRKLIRHIPEHYFNVIRHFGLLASRVKTPYKEITDRLLPSPAETEKTPTWRERQTLFQGKDPLVCRICQKVMRLVSQHIPNPLSNIKSRLSTDFA